MGSAAADAASALVTTVAARYAQYQQDKIDAKSLEYLLRLETRQNLALLNTIDLGAESGAKKVLGPKSLTAVARHLEADVLERVWGPTSEAAVLRRHLARHHRRNNVDIAAVLEGTYVLVATFKKLGSIIEESEQDDDDVLDDEVVEKIDRLSKGEEDDDDAKVLESIDKLRMYKKNVVLLVLMLRARFARLKDCLDPSDGETYASGTCSNSCVTCLVS